MLIHPMVSALKALGQPYRSGADNEENNVGRVEIIAASATCRSWNLTVNGHSARNERSVVSNESSTPQLAIRTSFCLHSLYQAAITLLDVILLMFYSCHVNLYNRLHR